MNCTPMVISIAYCLTFLSHFKILLSIFKRFIIGFF